MSRDRFGGSRIGTHPGFTPREPSTEDEFYNQLYWDRRSGGLHEGATGQEPTVSNPGWRFYPDGTDNQADGSVDAGGGVIDRNPFTVSASRTAVYSLEIRDADDALVLSISDWLADGGELNMTLDQASKLRFVVPGDSAAVASLAPPNRVWIRDRWGLLIEIFRIASTNKRRDGDSTYFDCDCIGLLDQLAREPVLTYNTGFTGIVADEKSVREILEDLFSDQDQTPPVSIGDIDAAIAEYEMAFQIHQTSILDALLTLQKRLPKGIAGHFYIGPNGAFHWPVSFGVTEKTIEVGKALQGMTYHVDYSDQVTRLYMYGAGASPRTRLNLIDAGEANVYKESKTGTYGVIPSIRVDNRIKYADSLLLATNRILEEAADPVVTVSVDVLNLAATDTAGFEDISEFYPGSSYFVIDSDNNINVEVQVRAVTHNLAHILDIRIELNNRNRSLDDIMQSIVDQIQGKFNIEDDGSRNPYVGRTFDGEEGSIDGLGYRDGDHRHVFGGQFAEMQYRQDDDWRTLIPVYKVNEFEDLPTDPLIVEHHAFGHVGDRDWYFWRRPTTEWLPLGTTALDAQTIINLINAYEGAEKITNLALVVADGVTSTKIWNTAAGDDVVTSVDDVHAIRGDDTAGNVVT